MNSQTLTLDQLQADNSIPIWIATSYGPQIENPTVRTESEGHPMCFNMRWAGEFQRLSTEQRVAFLLEAARRFVARIPGLYLAKADSAESFLRTTNGFGVLWFYFTQAA